MSDFFRRKMVYDFDFMHCLKNTESQRYPCRAYLDSSPFFVRFFWCFLKLTLYIRFNLYGQKLIYLHLVQVLTEKILNLFRSSEFAIKFLDQNILSKKRQTFSVLEFNLFEGKEASPIVLSFLSRTFLPSTNVTTLAVSLELFRTMPLSSLRYSKSTLILNLRLSKSES